MYNLRIHPDAVGDLKELLAGSNRKAKAGARIAAFLQELKASQEWLDELLTRHYENDDFNVDKFVTFWDAGLDLWRIKVFESDFSKRPGWTLPFRVIYAYEITSRTFYVLAIAPRKFNYDPKHELTKRICCAYEDLGLPKHKIRVPSRAGNSDKPH
jgi:mRNA-degrading endonuclease RelE of RelBE toxin-antitoxin system